MKKSDLIEVIRKVVRKEVKAALKEQQDKIAPTTGEFGQMMEHAEGLFNKQKYTNDDALNEAMNMTANSKDEWRSMGGKTFTDGRAGLANAMGMASPDQMFGGKPTAQQMIPQDRQHVEIGDDLAGVLTRDYSGLMKAIEKKKGKK